MEDKNKKGMKELDNEDLEQAAGGGYGIIKDKKTGEMKAYTWNPSTGERKIFDTYEEAKKYHDKMGWKY